MENVKKIHENGLDDSFLVIENTIIESFRNYQALYEGATYQDYILTLEETNFEYLFQEYPLAKTIFTLYKEKNKYLKKIILERFNLLKEELYFLNNNLYEIEKLKLGFGDYHNGQSTSILELNNDKKIVYKPTNGAISQIFFNYLNWINPFYDLGKFEYKIYNFHTHHWLEFVYNKPCDYQSDLFLYFERAGFLLMILYTLNASDFHHENIIAFKNTPVTIDHETLIQPKINSQYHQLFKNYFVQHVEDSTIQTMLLPNHYGTSAMPIGSCGFGYHKQKSFPMITREALHQFTNDWRMVTKLKEENMQKENLPIFNNECFYINDFKISFIKGFEKAYDFFLQNREFLLHDTSSPLQEFNDIKIRFIWRSTNIYGKILDFMKLPKNLKKEEQYEKKIYDYLAVAFKNVTENSDLRLILKHEVAHMMRGDIPFFEVNSSSRDLHTDFGVIKDFFELSAVENIERKLKKLSLEDKEIQKNLILESLT